MLMIPFTSPLLACILLGRPLPEASIAMGPIVKRLAIRLDSHPADSAHEASSMKPLSVPCLHVVRTRAYPPVAVRAPLHVFISVQQAVRAVVMDDECAPCEDT